MTGKRLLPAWVKILALLAGGALAVWHGCYDRPVSFEKQLIQEEQGRHL